MDHMCLVNDVTVHIVLSNDLILEENRSATTNCCKQRSFATCALQTHKELMLVSNWSILVANSRKKPTASKNLSQTTKMIQMLRFHHRESQ